MTISFEDELKRWKPEVRDKAVADIERRLSTERKIWFCKRPRPQLVARADGQWEIIGGCDGRPHEGAPYAHARADQWPPPGISWLLWLVLSGRGAGKALDVDTPIALSTGGWKRMGDLVAGDWVFDEHGRPTEVRTAHTPYVARTMYRVNFSDGSAIDADGEHLWTTWTHRDRKQYLRKEQGRTEFPHGWAAKASITTQQMFDTQRQATARGDRNHCIPIASPLQRPTASLPIEPYALGAWLGDGSSASGAFTVADSDFAEMSAMLTEAGEPLGAKGYRKEGAACATYSMGVRPYARHPVTGNMAPNGSLHTRLRELGLLHNKHVPEMYAEASIAQRLDLLRGLMDTDGSADPIKSTVEFVSMSRVLAEGVLSLARSLSERPVLATGRAKIDGRDVGEKYRVTWRPSRFVPFALMRKAALLRPAGAQALRLRHRMVVSVQPIEPVTVRCITVDSPNALYLAGKALIPTHNTKTATEWVRSITKVVPAIALIGRRGVDVRATMIEGAGSGLIAACERAGMGYTWEPSKREFTFENGCKAFGYSAEEPDSLRGREHGAAWADEFCHMPLLGEVWSNLEFGLRVPGMPGGAKILGTSTPLPLPFLKEQIAKPSTRRVTVSTSANLENLDPGMRERILAAYAGTRKGRQELEGEILEDVEGALWSEDLIRVLPMLAEDMDRRIVAIDPAGTANRRSDETGIVTVGRRGSEGWVIADNSGKYSPQGWAKEAIDAYLRWGADAIVVEKNFGGDMVRTTIESQAKEQGVIVRVIVTTATRSKQLRAEPIVALYEQRKIHHVVHFQKLETEQLTWVPGKGDSPNRIDALVWGLGELFQSFGRANVASPAQAQQRLGQRPRSVATMPRSTFRRGFTR